MGKTKEDLRDDSKRLDKLEIIKDDKQPYIFISYKSDDWEIALEEIAFTLQKRHGVRIYYDRAFEYNNSGWTENMKKYIESPMCVAVLCFISPNYVSSYATLLEILTSQTKKVKRRDSRDKVKEIVPIMIEGFGYDECIKRAARKYGNEKTNISKIEWDAYQGCIKNILSDNVREACKNIEEKKNGEDLEKDDVIEAFEDLKDVIAKNEAKATLIHFDDSLKKRLESINEEFVKKEKEMNGYNGNGIFDETLIDEKAFDIPKTCEEESQKQSQEKEIVVQEIIQKEEKIVLQESVREEKNILKEEIISEEPVVLEEKEKEVKKAEILDTPEVKKKHKAVNVKQAGEKEIPVIDTYPERITKDMTLGTFETLFEDDKFAFYLRNLRSTGGKNYTKQFVDYLMAVLLRGCDKKAEEQTAKWKYCTYAVAKQVDLDNPSLGASQFTWQSNARKAVNIAGSGKLGENSEIFSKLSKDMTLGDIEVLFEREETGFVTKDNIMIKNVFSALYG